MFTTPPKKVRIVEVGPRDGLQNEKKPIDTADKFEFIRLLAEAGHTDIELTSFVRPDAIPQLSDAVELVTLVNAHKFPRKINFSALVPNQKGLEKAAELGVKEIALFLATSDSFSKRNINATVDESFERVKPVAKAALDAGIRVRGYLSTVYGCPYEGDVPLERVVSTAKRLQDLGVYEISLGDTTGVGTPRQVQEILDVLLLTMPADQLAAHFHDTRGMAAANALAALDMGITSFDSSAGGLGGCPYAKGASGNVATEDLVYMFESMGIHTGIDMVKLMEASRFMLSKLGVESASKVHRVLALDADK
ncbi:MAG: hydroxymethylglutaryl-CoA lyase [Alphaproteobacteria bacterium]|nr:hydroxymethylglutaryl-CoA lyase [Alphaproteobacteria bacterium]